METKNISTRAIDEILADPKKLEKFTVSYDRDNDDRKYEIMFAYRCYTLASLNEVNKRKFEKFNELNTETTADFGYFLRRIANSENFPGCDFKVTPILELYESLLRENWNSLTTERKSLQNDYTASINIQICNAIENFLRSHVLTKAATQEL